MLTKNLSRSVWTFLNKPNIWIRIIWFFSKLDFQMNFIFIKQMFSQVLWCVLLQKLEQIHRLPPPWTQYTRRKLRLTPGRSGYRRQPFPNRKLGPFLRPSLKSRSQRSTAPEKCFRFVFRIKLASSWFSIFFLSDSLWKLCHFLVPINNFMKLYSFEQN